MHAPSNSSGPISAHQVPIPMLCLVGVVLLFSTVAPATKYVFQLSQLDPSILACARVGIGFLFLLPATLVSDSHGLAALTWRHIMRLTVLGWLGVVSYAVAAWGLQYTTVSHYIMIYSLIPTFTTIFGICLGSQVLRPLTAVGMVCASLGCVIAISDSSTFKEWTFNLGDGCALLYTVMMAAHIAWSGGMAKQFGILTANTVMFGMSFLVLLLATLASGKQLGPMSYPLMGMVVYIGLATVGAFILRYRCLRSLAPATVATYHNLIPICTILLAYLFLDEPIDTHMILGGLTIVVGIKFVRGNYDEGRWIEWLLAFRPNTSAKACWARRHRKSCTLPSDGLSSSRSGRGARTDDPNRGSDNPVGDKNPSKIPISLCLLRVAAAVRNSAPGPRSLFRRRRD